MVEGIGPKIKILNSVYCQACPEAKAIIAPILKYKYKFYLRKVFGGGETKIVDKTLIERNGYFLSGLLQTIKKNFREIEIDGNFERLKPTNKTPQIKNITLREDQIQAIRRMKIKQRGIIVFPTGSGKTIIMVGFISMFLGYRILILCHTKDLIKQISEELTKAGFFHHILTGENKINFQELKKNDSCILLSTDKSYIKIDPKLTSSFFDITLVDEVHHVANEQTNYGRIMKTNLSPIKIGFTATIPTDQYKSLIIQGFFGEVISQLKGEDQSKIIAKAKVNLIPVPRNDSFVNIRSYQEIYKKCLVNNQQRNNLIVETGLKSIQNDEQVLIIVDQVDHGNILKNIFRESNVDCPFIQGIETSDYRNKIRSELKRRKLMIAIATKVWKEGINIPTLNHIIFAAGGKDEISIRQAMGRGLRLAENKTEIHLTDFMDPYKYLAEHSIERFTVYRALKWI